MDCIAMIRRLLKREEGFVSHCYQDTLGYYTIGYGKLIDKRKGGGITEAEACILLDNEILSKIEELNAKIPWWSRLDDVRKTVVLAMAFQLGVPGLLEFKQTLNSLEHGDWSGAAGHMMSSTWAAQTPLRAARMATAIRTGILEV
jgi:lysozyme